MHDSRGLAISAPSSEAIDAYENALASFLNYESSAGAEIKSTLAEYPDLAMASILRGYMTLMVESRAIQDRVKQMANTLVESPDQLNARELQHATALRQWASGDPAGAALVWDLILAENPHDLLALKLHHYTTFWRGRPATLRSTVESVLPFWDESVQGFDHVLGMHAFALNESGRFEAAEAVGRHAVERNPEDLWSVHSVAHALEMRGDIAGGVTWFRDKLDRWDSKNPFRGHLWWHAILFPYAAGHYDEVLELYDTALVPQSTEFFLDIQNRASILARLEIAGVDVNDRWSELSEFSANRIGDHVLAFTDLHCCLALASGDRRSELSRFVQSMEAHKQDLQLSDYDSAGYETALILARGIEQWAQGDAAGAAGQLWSIRDELSPIGGSYAQQSVFVALIAKILDDAGDRRSTALMASRHRKFPHHMPTIDSLLSALLAADSSKQFSKSLQSELKSSKISLSELETSYGR